LAFFANLPLDHRRSLKLLFILFFSLLPQDHRRDPGRQRLSLNWFVLLAGRACALHRSLWRLYCLSAIRSASLSYSSSAVPMARFACSPARFGDRLDREDEQLWQNKGLTVLLLNDPLLDDSILSRPGPVLWT